MTDDQSTKPILHRGLGNQLLLQCKIRFKNLHKSNVIKLFFSHANYNQTTDAKIKFDNNNIIQF